ncbi:NAD(P)-dependent oxidoreductase [Actinokineospora iranica]|uniref:3-hydroxyisobutyrate dehydrogenase n=1 Tax=Actinokineospora iranica TaxID=1271860 RepID=A0A1G6S0C8_9PSEU|nr:NAD(P)-binding domain-containing protein [Actinokineospora iranica]SDD09627.1 3-hydroxyisobutyrate dehydrogenase [Actinokineospora iranica]
MASTGKTDVTVIGLGDMGKALAEAFLAAGHSTTVWNRTASKADDLVAKGAHRADSVADAVRASEAVVICVLDYRAVKDVFEQAGDALDGSVVFNITNGLPAEAKEAAALAKEKGCAYIDGGIMAVPPMIGKPGAFVLYSGESQAVFEDNKPLLEVLGDARFTGTDPGHASLLDLALNGAMYGMLGGAVHAMAVVGSEGIGAQDFSTSLLIPYLTGIMGIVPHFAKQIDTGEYTVDVAATLAMQQVGFRNIRQASVDQGISSALLDPMQDLMDKRVAAGFGSDDFSGVYEALKLEG